MYVFAVAGLEVFLNLQNDSANPLAVLEAFAWSVADPEYAGHLTDYVRQICLAEVIQFDDRLRYSSVKSHHSNSTRSVQSPLTFTYTIDVRAHGHRTDRSYAKSTPLNSILTIKWRFGHIRAAGGWRCAWYAARSLRFATAPTQTCTR